MTREEAYKKLQEGHKVTNSWFFVDEYLYMDENKIKTHEGTNYTTEFWNIEWIVFFLLGF